MEEKKITGYPSIDKPWLKYYNEEAISAKLPECTLYEYLYDTNKEHLQDCALNYFGRKIRYSELFENIDEVAKAFVAEGVSPGDIVSIVTLSSVISILCFYALNKIGAVSNYINVLATEDEFKEYFKEAGSKLVVTLDLFGEKVLSAAKLVGVKKIISYSLVEWMPAITHIGYSLKMRKVDLTFSSDSMVTSWGKFLSGAKGQNDITYRKNPHELCFLGHTGGTTGFPKSVMLDDYAMNAVAHQYNLTFTRKRGDSFLYVTIPFVIYGILTCMHMPLSLGCCIIIIPKYDPKDWPMYFRKYKPNHIATVPSFVSPMLNNKKLQNIDISYVSTVAVGGDGMNNTLENQMNDFLRRNNCNSNITKGYGLSEVCATAITEFDYANKIGSVGIPLVKNNIMIYNNEDDCECKYNQIGEICLDCPAKMIGYRNNEEETKKLFKTHNDSKQWLHTGDLGYVDEDGFLFLSGRIKRIILTTANGSGYKVSPNIPEKIISSHDAVNSICIVGAMSGVNQVLKAYIVLNLEAKGMENQIEEQVRELCRKALPDYSCPTFYEFRDKLPLTSAGKIDYQKLEKET